MARFLLLRTGSLLATLLAASLVIFALLEVVPGDVAAVMLGLNATPEAVAALRTELGSWGLTQLGVAVPNFWFAMLLVLLFRGDLRWFSGGRLSGLGRGLLGRAEGADAARGRAGAAAGGDPGAGDALGADRRAGPGLCPHRPRQGAERARRCAAARFAQRADPGADHPRAAVLLPAGRRDHHRERVLPARASGG
jgi:hypothetical protein